MSSLISAQSLIDIGFVSLVVFTCIRTLFGEKNTSHVKWHEDLRVLQESLRSLIDEASFASSQLDRNLLRRKDELEALLLKLDRPPQPCAQNEMPGSAPQSVASIPAARDLPNSSWSQPFDKSRALANPNGFELDNLIAEQRDSVSLSREAPPVASLENEVRPLRQNIQVVRDNDNGQRRTSPRRELSMNLSHDPAAYSIARRLLSQGQEIHVVSRKLDLPLAEVRLLDKLMRAENGDHDPAESDSVQQFSEEGGERMNAIERDYVLF